MTVDTIVRVDPKTLIVGANVRHDVKLSKEYVASIKLHGVKVPILAEEGPDGLVVIDGQRRVLAAVDAGVPLVPVFVTEPEKDDSARIVDQLVVNDQRASISGAESVVAVKQLELFGMPLGQIVKKTGYAKADVQAALTVATSAHATELLEVGIGLDHAAAIVEFDEFPDIVEDLSRVAIDRPASFEHFLQQARTKMQSEISRRAVAADLQERGYTLLEGERPSAALMLPTHLLYRDEALTEKVAESWYVELPAGTPGLTVILESEWARRGDDDESDDGVDDDDDDDAWELKWFPRFLIEGWQERGYFANSWSYKTSAAGNSEAVVKSDEQKAKESAARKMTIANNKAWPAATGVRVEWITHTLLAAKKLPANAQQLIAYKLTGNVPRESYGSGLDRAMEWLSIDRQNWAPTGALVYITTHPDQSERFNLAIALSSVEGEIGGKEGWRHHEQPKLALYLEVLQGWGYGLSELEQSLVDAEKGPVAS